MEGVVCSEKSGSGGGGAQAQWGGGKRGWDWKKTGGETPNITINAFLIIAYSWYT